jgi:hypothetical protein
MAVQSSFDSSVCKSIKILTMNSSVAGFALLRWQATAQFFDLHSEVKSWWKHGHSTGWTAPAEEQQKILLERESFACCHSSCLVLCLRFFSYVYSLISYAFLFHVHSLLISLAFYVSSCIYLFYSFFHSLILSLYDFLLISLPSLLSLFFSLYSFI